MLFMHAAADTIDLYNDSVNGLPWDVDSCFIVPPHGKGWECRSGCL